uniref:Thioredoxin domain-containing protein n=1 Tax=Rhizochromulina marina TaxID=1034831 RepID=A0A7S2WKL9_9STRA|mmetsp:Transcript_26370/g.76888  ORF Transcript_26370/g.76888 Transcript_26370/m.76888 type:complete len:265 (+) Transcript_26370:24-818(+)
MWCFLAVFALALPAEAAPVLPGRWVGSRQGLVPLDASHGAGGPWVPPERPAGSGESTCRGGHALDAADLPPALAVRGGAEPLTLDRSPLGTLALMLRAFFVSMTDPTYMMDLPGAEGGEEAAEDEPVDPFAARAKAGLGLGAKTITVDALDKMGGSTGKVKTVSSSADFNKLLTAAGKKLVVVDFFATWCGPCKQVAPKFVEASGQYGTRVHFLKVDVDAHKPLAQKYQVSSMPTFLFLKNGKVVDRISGANIDSVKQKINSLM